MCMRETASPYVSVGSACAAACKTSAAPQGRRRSRPTLRTIRSVGRFSFAGHGRRLSPPMHAASSSIRSSGKGGAHSGLSAMLMSFMGLSSAATRLALSAPQYRICGHSRRLQHTAHVRRCQVRAKKRGIPVAAAEKIRYTESKHPARRCPPHETVSAHGSPAAGAAARARLHRLRREAGARDRDDLARLRRRDRVPAQRPHRHVQRDRRPRAEHPRAGRQRHEYEHHPRGGARLGLRRARRDGAAGHVRVLSQDRAGAAGCGHPRRLPGLFLGCGAG